jgi:cell division protein FtsW
MAKKLAFDKVLFTVVVLLVGLGLVMVYSSTAALSRGVGGEVNRFFVRQLTWASLGMLLMWAAMHFDYRVWRKPVVAYGALGTVALMLVAVLFSPTLNDTQRWLFIGGFSIQPSEAAKLALIGFLAYQLDRKPGQVDRRQVLIPTLGATALLAGLVVLQPDLGTAVMLVAGAAVMLFLGGLRWRWIFAGAALAAPVLLWLAMSARYRRERLLSFLDPERDPLGSGFQALQSLIAVGSGGVTGLGPGKSLQKLYFLPYSHSDFIYSIAAEELGMVGALGIVALFALLLWRGLRAGWRAPDNLGRYLAWGLTAVLVLQAFCNISVATALLPTKGIPLPFVSYGGSSLVVSLVSAGVLLNVSQHG